MIRCSGRGRATTTRQRGRAGDGRRSGRLAGEHGAPTGGCAYFFSGNGNKR